MTATALGSPLNAGGAHALEVRGGGRVASIHWQDYDHEHYAQREANLDEPHFLFIGSTTDKEGATTRIKASGGTFRKKLLQSKPENWAVIAEMLQAEDVKDDMHPAA